MVAELQDDQIRGLTAQVVARWVQSYIDNGSKPIDAAAAVLRDACEGQYAEGLTILGPVPICALWQQDRREHPKPVKQPRMPETVVMPAPPSRRVDIDRLKESSSLLEGMYQINGQWLRLGDMDKSSCRAASVHFKSKALENAHSARYFHELAKTLNGGETVRQRFDDAALMRIWDLAERSA